MEATAQLELSLSDGSGAPRWPTRVHVRWNAESLRVRFECRDGFRWATFTERDQPLWQEEVVELFIAPGAEHPKRYFEIELNPNGALFDATIHNPEGRRDTMTADLSWDCPGIQWRVGHGDGQDWWAELDLPLRSLLDDPASPIPPIWRANFFRVERPQGPDRPEADEYSSWSPTFRRPADFHLPKNFGYLSLDEDSGLGENSGHADDDAGSLPRLDLS